ncbi:NAD(+) synthase [Dielma fastidiosa]|uniref:Glutamine-dependent NAD(+) synthetase n=1 Tax=Dielma fastidiosa TaxID=1034346 RepID=A0A318KK12_9FIRM|nr:NAD(+) synthase [Dielma fastidiosa]PXX78119.1 NAD+ synthase (glutamine-hydrolysing) [Dielma fastidiosa]
MKIALSSMQINPGDCQANYLKMQAQIKEAIAMQAELIVFPQNALSGTYLGELWQNDDFCQFADSFNELLIEASDQIAIVWGNVKYRHGHLFNCAFFAWQKETRMKVKHPEHHFMDEALYFEDSAIDSEIEYKGELLKLNFGTDTEADVFNINLDHHPYCRDLMCCLHHSGVYVNALCVESYGKNVFICPGGPAYYEDGELISSAPFLHDGLTLIDTQQPNHQKHELCELDVMLYGLKTFDAQVLGGKMPWIIGLSGGLDSSVNAALITMAFGPDRVYAYNLATAHNSSATKQNAQQLADALGIRLNNGAITQLVEASRDVLCNEYGYDDSKWPSLVMENIQARIRGHLLSSFAAIHGGVVVNNGNKVEVALGYCTLYGDAIGVLSPIGDCTKCDLFALSKQINELYEKEVIPWNLLPEVSDKIEWETPPSAELKNDQLDPMKWFYHDQLLDDLLSGMDPCEYLRAYQSKELFAGKYGFWLKLYGLDDPQEFVKDFCWFTSTLRRNAFKQLQTPPILSLSSKPFGTIPVIQGHAVYPQCEKLLKEITEA